MPFVTYQFRLCPTPAQEAALGHQLETLRQVYNAALQWWKDAYQYEKAGRGEVILRKKRADGSVKKCDLMETLYPVFANLRNLQLEAIRNGEPGPHWLAMVSATAMRDTLRKVESAFQHFYRRLRRADKKLGYPRFKARNKLRSIPFKNYPEAGCSLRHPGGVHPRKPKGGVIRGDHSGVGRSYRLYVAHVGTILTFVHRPIVGIIKSADVVRERDGRWHVFLVSEQPECVVEKKVTGGAVGVDVGIANFLTTSDGQHVETPYFLKAALPRIRRAQRAVSRKLGLARKSKRKPSDCKNLQKAFRKVSRIHSRIRNQRRGFHHKQAKLLVDRYATICVENLNVSNMMRLGNLSRYIQDAGWKTFVRKLKQHAAKAGVSVIEVNPQYTSQTCSLCGHCSADNRQSQAGFRCLGCGHSEHADVNAAKNILNRASGGAGRSPVRHNVGPLAGGRPPTKTKRAAQNR